jgi:hypothetical protein
MYVKSDEIQYFWVQEHVGKGIQISSTRLKVLVPYDRSVSERGENYSAFN